VLLARHELLFNNHDDMASALTVTALSETLNLAQMLITRSTNEKNSKLGQWGSGRDHITYF